MEAINKVPPSPKHRVQDTRKGHVIVLNEAGLEPTYVSKKVSAIIDLYVALAIRGKL